MRTNALSLPDTADPEFLWRNGEIVPWASATVHVNAVGHASVSAVFEGIKAYKADRGAELLVFRLEDHMARLVESTRLARIALGFDCGTLCEGVVELLRRNRTAVDTYIRPWCFVSGIVRQALVPDGVATETAIDGWPFRSTLESDGGARVGISSFRRIDDQVMPPRIKAFSNYHNSRLAALEATRNGLDGAIMLDRDGMVTEGPASCVALVRNGVLITPPVSCGLLDGITRDTILTLAREDLGIKVEERPVDRTELYLANETFFMGTGWELLPVFQVDGLQIGNGKKGPVVTRLGTFYTDLVRGRADDRRGWTRRVPIA
jgi:branched-chain amino acid aminotransferase